MYSHAMVEMPALPWHLTKFFKFQASYGAFLHNKDFDRIVFRPSGSNTGFSRGSLIVVVGHHFVDSFL